MSIPSFRGAPAGCLIGINLNPNNACNWRCIYCQVPDLKRGAAPPIDLARLETELREFIALLQHGDFMRSRSGRRAPDRRCRFSGNGEPTSAREFPETIELAGRVLRDAGLQEGVRLRLITNGSLLGAFPRASGSAAAGRSGGRSLVQGRRRQRGGLSPHQRRGYVARFGGPALCACARGLCPTWVQTCLFALDGQEPTEVGLAAYAAVLVEAGIANLAGVHLYGLARPSRQPEASRLTSLSEDRLAAIAERLRALGLTVNVSP
jgi:hypothetical protein